MQEYNLNGITVIFVLQIPEMCLFMRFQSSDDMI
jgi:hypothetical protein